MMSAKARSDQHVELASVRAGRFAAYRALMLVRQWGPV